MSVLLVGSTLAAFAVATLQPGYVPPCPLPDGGWIDQHLIYFEVGAIKPAASARNAAVLQSALCWTTVEPSHVDVVGHTDTAGPAEANDDLSKRRAEAVAEALVAVGVSRSAITTIPQGERTPAVATGDGVSEGLNRRVFIDVRPLSLSPQEPKTGR